MKKHQSFQNPPLMYIIQPDLEPIFSSMQKSYVTKKSGKKQKEKQGSTKKKDSNQTSSFHLFSNEQKINTLMNLPAGLEHVSCRIHTKQKKIYAGKIENYQDGYVYIQDAKIKFDEIEDIQLIGL